MDKQTLELCKNNRWTLVSFWLVLYMAFCYTFFSYLKIIRIVVDRNAMELQGALYLLGIITVAFGCFLAWTFPWVFYADEILRKNKWS